MRGVFARDRQLEQTLRGVEIGFRYNGSAPSTQPKPSSQSSANHFAETADASLPPRGVLREGWLV